MKQQFPPSRRVFHFDRFEFFPKFAEIFASQGAPLVSTTLREFSKKIRNGPNGVIRSLGETDPCRKPEVKNFVALSL
jgi:hypothetical protein